MSDAPRLRVRLQADAFDAATEYREMCARNPDAGACVMFVGTVRPVSKGRPLVSMTLEHYPGMTDAEMTRIAADATARWPIDDGLLVHRYGTLRPGDPIVLVIAAARHRADAFAAVEAMMDRLKTEAAFWKKELYSDASEQWVDAEQADTDRAARWD